MKNQERLFLAIGGADPALVARSEGKRRARWPGYCLAACLTLVVAVSSVLLWRTEPAISPPDEQQPPATVKPDPPEEKQDPGGARPPLLQPPGSELGTLRMVSYTVSSQEKTVDFLIYVNEEQFTIREEDGLYSIRSKNPLPDSFPECGLDIFHIPRTSVVEARAEAEKLFDDFLERYGEVILGDSAPGLYLRASNGTDWDSEQAEFSFVTDGQGGVFVIVSRYFLEAEEGLGMRFRDMASSFRVVSLEKTVPEWMRSLYETADRLFPALRLRPAGGGRGGGRLWRGCLGVSHRGLRGLCPGQRPGPGLRHGFRQAPAEPGGGGELQLSDHGAGSPGRAVEAGLVGH